MSGIRFGKVNDLSKGPENIIIVASGPSAKDIRFAELKNLRDTLIIAVNGAGSHVPFANMWFTLDPWGLDGPQLPVNFKGKLYAAVPTDFGTAKAATPQHRNTPTADITYLHRLQSHNLVGVSSETAYVLGLSEDKSCISTGNSGYGAFNLAYHMRPKNIYIIGLDGSMGYWYDKRTTNRPLRFLPQMFDSTKKQIDAAGINVYNVSPNSAINTYQKISAVKFHEMIGEYNASN